ncbi:MAG: hypothetical protein M1830_006628 [Pleopsidium flavum]|nr:MAG: hypothetical protein M1830_006628 [Pleopsidium flavum]
MPPTLANDASAFQSAQSPEMEVTIPSTGQEKGQPAICPTDNDTITPRPAAGSKKVDKRSLDYVLRSGLAGGMAGCAAKTIVGPLDRVKILFQASSPQFAKYTGSWFGVVTAMRDINRQDGVRGLFRGHSATLLRIFPYAAIKFLAYEQIRAVIIKDKSQETPWRRLISGSLAGITSVFFTYPLEVIRVRLAFETKRDSRSSLSSICKQIYRESPHIPQPSPSTTISSSSSSSLPTAVASTIASTTATLQQTVTPRSGLANFYRGFSPTLWGMLPYAGMSFLTHDTASDWLRHPSIAAHTTLPTPSSHHLQTPNNNHKPPPLTYWAELLAGGFAGLVSQTASYPLEVIRRRMQVGGAVGDGHRLGMKETTARIWREKGWRGFWVGLTIGYFKVVPMVATSFFVYERGKLWLGI